MRCPNCNREMPERMIECPHCPPPRALMEHPGPIQPEAVGGGKLLGLVAGLLVAVLSAFGWDLLFSRNPSPQLWPAMALGVFVGAAVRVTGGPNDVLKGLIGLFCAGIGIGGGLLLMFYRLNFDPAKFMTLADVTNLAYVFIGLSLARSISAGKSKISLPK